jgi:hypothetical protein
MANVHVDIAKRPSGATVEVRGGDIDTPASTMQFGVAAPVVTNQPPLFVRAAANNAKVLAIYHGHTNDNAYVINDAGAELLIKASSGGNFNVAIEYDGVNFVCYATYLSGSGFIDKYERVVVNENCVEQSRQSDLDIPDDPLDCCGTVSGFYDVVGGVISWSHLPRTTRLGGQDFFNFKRRGDWTVGLQGNPNWVIAWHHTTSTLYSVDTGNNLLSPGLVETTGGDLIVAVSRDAGFFYTLTDLTTLAGAASAGSAAPVGGRKVAFAPTSKGSVVAPEHVTGATPVLIPLNVPFQGVVITDPAGTPTVVPFPTGAAATGGVVFLPNGTWGPLPPSVAAAAGRWEVLTTGVVEEPELVFDGLGDVIMVWVPTP